MNKAKKTTAKRRADKAMSNYIRERDNFVCYTCGFHGDKYNMDNGHLISRYWSATRYYEHNCNAQCKACNFLHENDPEIYKRKWIAEHGADAFESMYAWSKHVVKATVEYYLETEKNYKDKLAELRTERL